MHDPNGINFEKMRKMGGVEFECTVDPTDVEQWPDRMERVFEQLECSDFAKFKYAILLLQKDAYDWWVSVSNAKVKPLVLTWDDSPKEFRMKYVPPAYCNEKKKKFLNLRQRGMSIAEYEQKFLRFSRYAGGTIKMENEKCRKFEDGLNDPSRKNVAILQHENFCKLVSTAFTWERLDNEEASRNESRFQKPRPYFGGPSIRGRPRNIQTAGASGANQASGQRGTARAYAIRQRDDQDGQDVGVGKFHLFGLCVFTLFDPGSTHSYICSSLVLLENVKSMRLTYYLLVESPVGYQDGLAYKYHVVVDCRSNHVTFKDPTCSHISIQGERSLTSSIIFTALARKLMRQGCKAYLAHIVDTHLKSPCIKDIAAVCDFQEVFPKFLHELPSERDVEFPIELTPGSTPISITPYRMAREELKELKSQLQELLEKGFI
ncbi:uncharacterized protein LOC107006532 [Solanum pennellii]|uniref:Uncharacterized protein LOC107006532 n=1 Tax=Solanum pennellii TaxID=28526 RepID=A0ABM1FR56_SOLPN|nr:uncharacterized protein LOC107006532 [Solanum pennellii]